MKSFMSNDRNRKFPIEFYLINVTNMHQSWSVGNKVIRVCEKRCLTSIHGKETLSAEMSELNSTQEEAGTRIIFHCLSIGATAPEISTII